ncbi:non-hydrolyzing UDP-N-acetylglucosamine 2-epimerase [Methanoregula sp.]|uniref:non-hydrolyzing UDP-N-acetylglucosamine 2-epimerase n=1 Tax=Methanoregula sp. TaxID=2052170 RepID=UPI003BAEEE04
MKVMTILGTRPELIRLSRIIEKLDAQCTHVLVHTGQNFDKNLKDIFFKELGIRNPDYFLDTRGVTAGEQIAQILTRTEEVIEKEQPDRILLLGDTNSSLSAIIAKRQGIPVFHMEAGNRCYDDRVPEEVNRRIIDHTSDILMPYTERSRANLIREGIPHERIFVTGNPILEVINHYSDRIGGSDILERLKIEKNRFFLVTLHRSENVDLPDRLRGYLAALTALGRQYGMPVICSLHPRTRDKIRKFAIETDAEFLHFYEPFGFFDFIRLEQDACCVLSDSGTVQEECCIFHVPNVTLRDVTERPETLECGSNMLAGSDQETILGCVRLVLSAPPVWVAPREYLDEQVSTTVIRILLSYNLITPDKPGST